MNKEERNELRLLNNYTRKKLKELESCLNLLIDFARDDMRRLDKLEGKAKLKFALSRTCEEEKK